MKKDRLHLLFRSYLEQTLCESEETELMRILAGLKDDELKRLVEECYDTLPETYKLDEAASDRVYKLLVKRTSTKTYLPSFARGVFFTRFAAAAAVAIIFLTATLYIFNTEPENPAKEINKIVEIAKPLEKPLYKNDIKPGGNKAILTLADGTKVVLDDVKEGKLREQGNTTIIKLDSGKLAYNTRSESPTLEKIVQYNTLTTPRGGKYCVTLPDGTTVWLNASTTIKFPTSFTGKERRVDLSGEAYFEVAQNIEKPFIVFAANSRIKVCGTHFNVMAYPEDNESKTTLLEGCVEVSPVKISKNRFENSVVTLTPGQQASMNNISEIEVREANTEEAIAWKNGLFIFKNEEIESIMLKLSRWYGVNIIYDPSYKSIRLTGNISRSEKLSAVLRMLELTETVTFMIEGKNITVLPFN
ncbi:MAG: hypothetical protein A2X20_00135 [Bacteroidetes bacterium GWE2_40_15]|nr:MAG: hypothetical protein A2X20_00135 [Bacteroidetes bacterium GWE2_40_15]